MCSTYSSAYSSQQTSSKWLYFLQKVPDCFRLTLTVCGTYSMGCLWFNHSLTHPPERGCHWRMWLIKTTIVDQIANPQTVFWSEQVLIWHSSWYTNNWLENWAFNYNTFMNYHFKIYDPISYFIKHQSLIILITMTFFLPKCFLVGKRQIIWSLSFSVDFKLETSHYLHMASRPKDTMAFNQVHWQLNVE